MKRKERSGRLRWLHGILVVVVGIAAIVWWRTREQSPADGTTAEDRRREIEETVDRGAAGPPLAGASESGPNNPIPGGDRLALAEVVDERLVRDPGGVVVERWRLVRLVQDPERLARVVDYARETEGGRTFVHQEIMRADSLVVFVPKGDSAPSIVERLRDAGFEVRSARSHDAAIEVELPQSGLDAVPDGLRELNEEVPELHVEPNWLYFPTQVVPSDHDARSAWGLERVEASAAWTVGVGSSDVVVAVIDTGIDRSHPDLAANVWSHPGEIAGNGIDDDNNGFVDDISGWDFGSNDADASDEDGHGTHVSGILGAVGDNGVGIAGVNWHIGIIPLRIGNGVFDNAATLNALRYINQLRESGVPVVAVNASFGGGSFSGAFETELGVTRDLGILFVAAAGNDSANNDAVPFYPSGYNVENVIAVASINQGARLSSFSSFGASSVDIAAPGTGIRSTTMGGGYGHLNGTSMATPHVTGAIALTKAITPALTAPELRARILLSAVPTPELSGRVATGGYLNLRRSVAPGMLAPKIEIVSPAADVVALESSDPEVTLAAQLVSEDGMTPAAMIGWETVAGPGLVEFLSPASLMTSVRFPLDGVYRLRVSGTAGALVEYDEITVVVGDGDVSQSGLVAWWRFDESLGPAIDSSGSARTGTINGARRNPGIFGGAMRFDGVSSNLEFQAPDAPEITIAAWARAEAAGNSIFPRVVHMQSGLLFLGLDPLGDDGNGNNLKFTRDDGRDGRVWHTPAFTMSTGGLHHLAATFDAGIMDNTPRLYIDGRGHVVGTQGSAALPPGVPSGAGLIGDRGDGTRAWEGLLDEIRIYDRELAAEEIAVLARMPLIDALRAAPLLVEPPATPLSTKLRLASVSLPDGEVGVASIQWTSPDPRVSFDANGSEGVTVNATEPGDYDVRMDLTTSGGTHVARTFDVVINGGLVSTAGYYTGTTSDGSTFVLIVDESGNGTFFGGGRRVFAARQIEVSDFGTFSIDPSQSHGVAGFVGADGTVRGNLSGGGTFFGTRRAGLPGSIDPAREGYYFGGITRSTLRAHGIVAGTQVAVVIDDDEGAALAGEAAVSAGGTFSFTTGGNSITGTVGGDRIAGSIDSGIQGTRQFVLVREGASPQRRLVNLSVRGPAGQGEQVLIVGFFLEGSDNLPVLIRGIGPALEPLGVAGFLATPRLSLYRTSELLAANQGWDTGGTILADQIASTAARVGAFTLAGGVPDSALLAELPRGGFTAHVLGADGGVGNALAEIYDARTADLDVRLINVSARAPVGSGENIPIAGFVIGGDAPAFVLLRAVGPGLRPFGVQGVLPKPVITVFRGSEPFATAATWAIDRDADLLASVMAELGAFTLDPTMEDAALLLYLPPGSYTAHVNGDGGATGIALLEVYFVADL